MHTIKQSWKNQPRRELATMVFTIGWPSQGCIWHGVVHILIKNDVTTNKALLCFFNDLLCFLGGYGTIYMSDISSRYPEHALAIFRSGYTLSRSRNKPATYQATPIPVPCTGIFSITTKYKQKSSDYFTIKPTEEQERNDQRYSLLLWILLIMLRRFPINLKFPYCCVNKPKNTYATNEIRIFY